MWESETFPPHTIPTFDCSISGFSIGLFDAQENLIQARFNPTPFSHTEYLVTEMQTLLQDNNVKFTDLSYIVTTKGPGSFTGIRVGLAAAAGLKAALRIPVITVNTLLAMGMASSENTVRHVILDTKCGDVYYQRFVAKGDTVEASSEPVAERLSDLQSLIQDGVCITHTTMLEILDDINIPTLATELTPTHVFNASKIAPMHDLIPLYIRPVNAKPQQS